MPVVRHAPRRGGASGERGLTPPRRGSSSDDTGVLLRPALELAWAVARAGERLEPPVPAPRPLRPLLRFARLPARALDVVRKVVDEDPKFRARVVAAAEEVELSPPARLFLFRPDGWAGELEARLETARAEQEGRQGQEDERDTRRRVKVAEDAVQRVETALAHERERALRLTEELRVERRLRRSADEEAAAERRRAETFSVDSSRARRALEDATAELERLRAAVGNGPDLGTVAAEISEAAEAAGALASRLRAAAEALASPPAEAAGVVDQDHRGPAPASRSSPRRGKRRSAPSTAPAGPRRPARLPPGLRDDSAEAAEHLVRVAGVVLVVDGYNASLAWRPSLPIAEQRRRLVDALEELASRTQSDVQVVFDGVEPSQPVAPAGQRRKVRVRFSPPEVEADDIVVGLVDELRSHRPVVVASNDRAVQERAQQRGANTISVSQLMAVLRRRR